MPIGTPIFICGHPKSGTTLLATLLDDHSQLTVFPEETFYLDMLNGSPQRTPGEGMEWLLQEGACRYLSMDIVQNELRGDSDYSDFDFETFQKSFGHHFDTGPQTHARVFEALMAAYAHVTSQTGKRYWVEKTPGTERYLRQLKTWYPDLRAIYIVRDPRDVYASYARKKERESEGQRQLSVEEFVARWSRSVWEWRRYSAQDANTLTVRYEDLLRYPQQILSLVCGFLGVEYETVLETPTKIGKPWSGNSMHGDRFSSISTTPIGRWKNLLAPNQLYMLETYLGKAMIMFGYQPVHGPQPLHKAIRLWLQQSTRRRRVLGMLIRLYWPFQLPKRLTRD